MHPGPGRSASFVCLAVFVVVFRLVLQVLIGDRVPGTTLFTLPSVDLPSWMAGMSLGGRVTVEALVDAFQQGLQLAVVLICFGAREQPLQPLPHAAGAAGRARTKPAWR